MDLPRELEWREAGRILPLDRLGLRLRSAALPLLADWFRYELLDKTHCLWIDADVICIRPIDINQPYIFGYESALQVGNAVLMAPPGSNLLRKMRALFYSKEAMIPPWFGSVRRARYRVKKLLRMHKDITTLPYASSGPRALTWHMRAEGLVRFVQPREVFYPLSYADVSLLRDPDFDLETVITPQTRCVHLWNQSLQMANFTAGDPVGRVFDSLGVARK